MIPRPTGQFCCKCNGRCHRKRHGKHTFWTCSQCGEPWNIASTLTRAIPAYAEQPLVADSATLRAMRRMVAR